VLEDRSPYWPLRGPPQTRAASSPWSPLVLPLPLASVRLGPLIQYNLAPSGGEGFSPPSALLTFPLVQYHSLRSWDVFLSLFGLFSQLAHAHSVLALLDPPVYRGKLPSSQFHSHYSLTSTGNKKPHVAFYVFLFLFVQVYFTSALLCQG